MDKVRLLFCAESLDMNGAMKSLLALLGALPRNIFDISLFVCSHHGVLQQSIPAGVTILPEVPAYAVFRLSFVKGLCYALKHWRVDLFVARSWVPVARWLHLPGAFWWLRPTIQGEWDGVFAYADGFIGQVAVKKVSTGRKYLWVHTDYRICPESQATAKAFSQAAGAVTVSQDATRAFRTWYEQEMGRAYDRPVYLLYNIIDAREICQRAREAVDLPARVTRRFRLVTVGRFSPPKNPLAIPRMARLLKAHKRSFEWFYVGGGQGIEAMPRILQEAGVVDCVHFVGEQTNPMPWVASADVIVQPSRWEGWGMTVSEALVLNKPVVVSDLPVLREQVFQGKNGFLCPLDDDEAFVKAIEELMDNPGLRERLTTYSEAYPFTAEKVCKEFYEQFCQGCCR